MMRRDSSVTSKAKQRRSDNQSRYRSPMEDKAKSRGKTMPGELLASGALSMTSYRDANQGSSVKRLDTPPPPPYAGPLMASKLLLVKIHWMDPH